jgi:Phytanoyl-CoA dioxygenase (PhyH)
MPPLLPSWLRRSPPGPLTRRGLLASDLWVDQPDAHRRIAALLAAGEVDEERAARLGQFVDEGFTTFPLEGPPERFAAVAGDVERAWRERPGDLAYAYHSGLKLFPLADEEAERRPSYRIADFHSFSEAARDLFLDRRIFEHVELIFGTPAVATQSLTFEFGSQQELHRDPVHVQMSPPAHLTAAWIALEDIDPRCGPLTYVPGSHRLPYFRFADGDYRFHAGHHGEAEVRRAAEFDARECRGAALARVAFTPRRGEVLLWHHSLLHGGSVPEDPALTRRSFVVHFTTLGDYPRLRQTVLVPDPAGGPPRSRTFGTDRLLTAEGARGFDNPLRGYAPG